MADVQELRLVLTVPDIDRIEVGQRVANVRLHMPNGMQLTLFTPRE